MTEVSFWTEAFKLAFGLGLGGLLLVAIAYYFRQENIKLANKLEAAGDTKIALLQAENKVKMSIIEAQNQWCMDDRKMLHARNEAQQVQINELNARILDIYKSRHDRMVVERLQGINDTAAATKTDTHPPSS